MADFTTTLSAPQGAGANPVAPVQEQQVPFQPNPLLEVVTNIFAKGIANQRQQDALDRKNAVVGEYVKSQNVYSDALTSGSWNAAQVGTASRANYAKFAASYPEYITELNEARKSLTEGTEIGEAQRQVQDEQKRFNDDLDRASAAGFTIYPNMSKDAKEKTIAANKAQITLDKQTADALKANAETRAVNAENRSAQTHLFTMQEHVNKQNAIRGLVDIADKNFDALNSIQKDLLGNPSIPFEQKQLLFNDNVNRIKQGLQAIAAQNPELAAPWQKLVDDIGSSFTKLADPKTKSDTELQLLKNEFDSRMYKAKLMVTTEPKYLNAVAVSSLFGNNPTLIQLAGTPVITGLLAQLGLGPDAGTNSPQVVGTPDEKAVLSTLKGSLSLIQKGSAIGDKNKNQLEAVNSVNNVLKQTGNLSGPIPASQLKELTSFYGSPEFGKLSEQGLLDIGTMQNAKKVFQVNYEPAVKQAVEGRLLQSIDYAPARGGAPFRQGGQRIIDNVDIKFNGSGVSFVEKPNAQQTISSSATTDALKEAEQGLNAVIRMGAHLEGTTNYAKYWEDNKHLLMPSVFPDPAKLKVGQVVKAKNGKSYKYIGGDFNNIKSSYMEVPSGSSE